MARKIVLGFDDSRGARSALGFASDMALASGAHLVVAHVFEWSPYSFLTPQELEERHRRREEEIDRAEKALIGPVMEELGRRGVDASKTLRYGHVARTLRDVIVDTEAFQVVIGRTGHSSLSERFFGSVAGSLAQVSPVPVTIVP